jgi:hypothetical protein
VQVQVHYVVTRDHPDPRGRIVAIGGRDAGGPWSMTAAEAVQGIITGRHRFWAIIGDRVVWIGVGLHDGQLYLRAAMEPLEPSFLLSLPDRAPSRRRGSVAQPEAAVVIG